MRTTVFTDRSIFIILFMFFTMHNAAYGGCQHTSDEFSCVEFVKNYDGDTLTFNIQKVHPILGDQMNVRVAGIDSPEMRSGNSCEARLAREAQSEVEKIMKQAHRLDLVRIQRGKFFRVVADVIFDGQSLRDYMLHKKLAVPYDGGHKEDVDWCQFF